MLWVAGRRLPTTPGLCQPEEGNQEFVQINAARSLLAVIDLNNLIKCPVQIYDFKCCVF